MYLNLSNYQLEIECYDQSFVYMKHTVNTNQKFVRDIQEIEKGIQPQN